MSNTIGNGSKVQDRITKKQGVVFGTATYTYGEDSHWVMLEGEKEPRWINVSQLEHIVQEEAAESNN